MLIHKWSHCQGLFVSEEEAKCDPPCDVNPDATMLESGDKKTLKIEVSQGKMTCHSLDSDMSLTGQLHVTHKAVTCHSQGSDMSLTAQ